LNGQPLFNAKDVGTVLGIVDVNSTTREWTEKQAVKVTNSDMQDLHIRKLNNAGEKFLTESGVYKLVMRSNKPEAEKFQDWIAEEVLPSIRKNGGYIANQENLTTEQVLANAVLVAQNVIAEKQRLLDEAIRTKAQIGNKREATAMAKASSAVRKANALELELKTTQSELEIIKKTSNDYMTIMAVENKLRIKHGTIAWREVASYCKKHNLEVKKVPDERYGEVNSYPKVAFEDILQVEINC
jgi:prophage antirepressor-like protein